MFHIGVATQHPPLPEPGQLSDLGIKFIKQCLTIDAILRPTATELVNHAWMIEFRETLMRYEDAELTVESTSDNRAYENASVAASRQATNLQEAEIREIRRPSPVTPPLNES